MIPGGYRHELKWFITEFDRLALRQKLAGVMRRDSHALAGGEYSVRSLYFDDLQESALFGKLSGIQAKSKFRIRAYNLSDSFIRLEKKVKYGDLIRKVVRRISREDHDAILAGRTSFLRATDDPLLLEFYTLYHSVVLRPRVVVDYAREAFFLPGGDIRVTLDRQVSSGLMAVDMFREKLPLLGMVDEGWTVLEVKFSSYFPDSIRNVIQLGNRNRLSVSKYALCRKMTKTNSWEDN